MKYLGNINRCGIPNLYMIANGRLGIITNFFIQSSGTLAKAMFKLESNHNNILGYNNGGISPLGTNIIEHVWNSCYMLNVKYYLYGAWNRKEKQQHCVHNHNKPVCVHNEPDTVIFNLHQTLS